MGLTLPDGLSKALGLMGVTFPSTDEDTLTSAANDWDSLATQCSGWKSDLTAAVSYVTANNEGDAANAFSSYMNGTSNVTGVEALGKACTAIAQGHRDAASAVKSLKEAYIAAAAAVKSSLDAAEKQPNDSTAEAGAMTLAQQQGAKLRELDQQTASKIQGA